METSLMNEVLSRKFILRAPKIKTELASQVSGKQSSRHKHSSSLLELFSRFTHFSLQQMFLITYCILRAVVVSGVTKMSKVLHF